MSAAIAARLEPYSATGSTPPTALQHQQTRPPLRPELAWKNTEYAGSRNYAFRNFIWKSHKRDSHLPASLIRRYIEWATRPHPSTESRASPGGEQFVLAFLVMFFIWRARRRRTSAARYAAYGIAETTQRRGIDARLNWPRGIFPVDAGRRVKRLAKARYRRFISQYKPPVAASLPRRLTHAVTS